MRQRWPAIRLTLVLLYLGVLPQMPDAPLLVAFALLAAAVVVAVPVMVRFASTFARAAVGSRHPAASGTPDPSFPVRPAAAHTLGTARPRAPSRLVAACG